MDVKDGNYYKNLKFRLWLGDSPINDVETGELIGYDRPKHVVEFCQSIWATGESPLQHYLREIDAIH